MKKLLVLFAILGLSIGSAEAQSACSFIQTRAVLTAAQWNFCFQQKQDVLGFTPVNKAGDVMLGPLITVAPNTSLAGFNLAPGVSPTSPANGDLWTTSAGLFVRINGVTSSVALSGGSPNFTSLVTINLTGGSLPSPDAGAVLHGAAASTQTTRAEMTAFGATATFTGRASSGTFASPAALTAGSKIVAFNAHGFDGSVWTTISFGSFHIYADGLWTSTSHPTETCEAVTTSGVSAVMADAWCVHATGQAMLGAQATLASATALLTLNGTGLTSSYPAPYVGTVLHFYSNATTAIEIDAYSGQASVVTRTSAGSAASPSAILTGSPMGVFAGYGRGATGYNANAYAGMSFQAAQNFSDTAMGSEIHFYTTTNNTVLAVDRAHFTNDGLLIISPSAVVAPAPGANFTVSSNTSSPLPSNGNQVLAQFVAANTVQEAVVLDGYGGAGTNFFLTFRNARGTLASPTPSLSGDTLGFIGFVGMATAGGYASSNGSNGGAFIGASATENWSATNEGTKLTFWATGNTTAVIGNTMTLQAGLYVGFPGAYTDPGLGRIILNSNVASTVWPAAISGAANIFQVVGAAGTQASMSIDTFASNGLFVFRRADGTIASPTQVLSGEVLGGVNAYLWGSDAAYHAGPSMAFFATENTTATAVGSKIAFFAVTNTTTGSVNSVTIQTGLYVGTSGYFDPGNGHIGLLGTTVLASPPAGTVEFDGNAYYATPTANNRGAIASAHFMSITSNFTLSNVNTAQKAFNATTNGQITLPGSTAYFFEFAYIITNTGTTSHNWSVLFGGGATLTSGAMVCHGISATGVGTNLTPQFGYSNTLTTALTVTTASTSATENVTIQCSGRVNINAGGTFIPQVQMSAAPGGTQTMLANSYFRMWAIGSGSVASVGNWN